MQSPAIALSIAPPSLFPKGRPHGRPVDHLSWEPQEAGAVPASAPSLNSSPGFSGDSRLISHKEVYLCLGARRQPWRKWCNGQRTT
jgi:hypothetical protein